MFPVLAVDTPGSYAVLMYGIKSSDEQEVKNLGARITTKNLYKQMEKIRKERERFIKKNPWFLLEYESLTE